MYAVTFNRILLKARHERNISFEKPIFMSGKFKALNTADNGIITFRELNHYFLKIINIIYIFYC